MIKVMMDEFSGADIVKKLKNFEEDTSNKVGLLNCFRNLN